MPIEFKRVPHHPNGGYWLADFDGKKHRHQHRHPNRKAAEKDVIDNGGPLSFFLRKDMLVCSAVDAYEAWLKGTGRLTYHAELSLVRRLLFAHLEKPIASLTREHFTAILADHQRPNNERPWLKPKAIGPWPYSVVKRQTKPSTISIHFKALAAFMFFCVARSFRDTDPVEALAATVRAPVDAPKIVVPPGTHLSIIKAHATLPQRALLGLLSEAGARPTEIGRLLWKDVDLIGNWIFLRHTVFRGDDPARPAGRFVPLTLALKLELIALRAATGGSPGERVINPANRQLQISELIGEILSALQVRAGFPGHKRGPRAWSGEYRAADFRNVAAQRWCLQHKNVRVVSELLNLTPVMVRRRYGSWLDRKGDVAAFHARQARKVA